MAAILNIFSEIAKSLTPPPPFTGAEYDGLEYRWKNFVFRPALFKVEAFLLVAFAFYIFAFLVGKTLNKSRAQSWLNAHQELLSQQFSKPVSSSGLVSDGYCDYFTFSTGRRNIASLHSIIKLLPRHDLAKMINRFVWGVIELVYKDEDEIELDFRLFPSSTPGFVWGIVSKNHLAHSKKNRWDLTLTRTTENPALNNGYCVMSEYADITDTILKSTGPLNIGQVLNDPSIKPYFKSLTITDQPRERPLKPIPADKRERHVILSLRAPPPSASHITIPLIKSIFAFIDAVESPKFTLRPETRTKLRKSREELDEQIQKEADAERKEEEEEKKAAAKKRAEEERLNKLSASEQKKELEKERKRQMRKAQGKVIKK